VFKLLSTVAGATNVEPSTTALKAVLLASATPMVYSPALAIFTLIASFAATVALAIPKPMFSPTVVAGETAETLANSPSLQHIHSMCHLW
jgi:hypothetical protein